MTNLEVLYTVQHIAQVFGKNLEMALEQFNNLLNISQQELFKEFASGYLAGKGEEVNANVFNALAPFRGEKVFTGATNGVIYGFTTTRYTLSISDYLYESAFILDDNLDFPNKVVGVDILTGTEFTERLQNAITYPTEEYPVMVISNLGTSRYAYLFPRFSTAPQIYAAYLRIPTTPSLVETITNGVRVQSGSSVALEFDSIYHVDIIRIILKYLGLSVGSDFVRNFVEQQKQNES